MHRGSRKGTARSGNTVAFGEYGLMALERCWMDTKQIEAARVAITRHLKRRGKVWIRIFPDKSFTPALADSFNREIETMFDDSRDFIQIHYYFSPRTDTGLSGPSRSRR